MNTYERQLRQLARQHGLAVVWARNGHMRIVDADGKTVVTASGTPRNATQALQNVARDLAKHEVEK